MAEWEKYIFHLKESARKTDTIMMPTAYVHLDGATRTLCESMPEFPDSDSFALIHAA